MSFQFDSIDLNQKTYHITGDFESDTETPFVKYLEEHFNQTYRELHQWSGVGALVNQKLIHHEPFYVCLSGLEALI